METRFRIREIVVFVFAVIILLPILFTAAPWTVKAQESPVVIGSPAKLSPKQQLLYVMARSPLFASLIEESGQLETASDVAPSWAGSGEGVAPEAPTAFQIEYWRYVSAMCFVKASGFAGLKVDWKQYAGGTSYFGDCSFLIEYGAEYTGATAMPDDKVIADTWKKGMKFGLDQPYYVQTHSTEFDDYSNCDGVGLDYYPDTGAVIIGIGGTPGQHWR